MIDGKLCLPMIKYTADKEDEIQEWFSSYDIPYNILVDEIDKFDDSDIINIVWLSSQAAERLEDKQKEMSEEEFKTFFFNVLEKEK